MFYAIVLIEGNWFLCILPLFVLEMLLFKRKMYQYMKCDPYLVLDH